LDAREPTPARSGSGSTSLERPTSSTREDKGSVRTLGPLDRDLLEDLQRLEAVERPQGDTPSVSGASTSADAGRRLVAALIDAMVLAVVTTGVLAITLRWCELSLDEIRVLPVAPTAAFLMLVALSYLLMFTAAGGQTLGKMAVGIRVIGDEAEIPVSASRIVVREVVALPTVLALGAGLVPAMLGDRRALHDRLSHTRVVRA
jgi:uncharacterized RDD family membrane protein YckC